MFIFELRQLILLLIVNLIFYESLESFCFYKLLDLTASHRVWRSVYVIPFPVHRLHKTKPTSILRVVRKRILQFFYIG